MKNSVIQEQVRTIVQAQPCNQRRKDALHAAWETLELFLIQHAELPERLQDIAPGYLAAFIMHCYRCGAVEGSLHMTLGALRTLLKEAGHPAENLATLTAPVRRERMPNSSNGRYQYRPRFIDATSLRSNAVSFPDEEISTPGND